MTEKGPSAARQSLICWEIRFLCMTVSSRLKMCCDRWPAIWLLLHFNAVFEVYCLLQIFQCLILTMLSGPNASRGRLQHFRQVAATISHIFECLHQRANTTECRRWRRRRINLMLLISSLGEGH
jgi:hypothetical protein